MKKQLEKYTESFEKYFSLLSEWNEKINLTAITEREEVWTKHFYDSLVGEKYIPNGARVLDIGSGAGFPGVPIKIIRPDLDVTLLDSVGKKVNFLSLVINELGLVGIKAVHSRIEDLTEKESFDIVTARAVARLNVLVEYALPFVKIGGAFLAYKSVLSEEEIEEARTALDILGGEVETAKEETVGDNLRTVIVIRKVKKTSEKYPRGKNLPRLKPIK